MARHADCTRSLASGEHVWTPKLAASSGSHASAWPPAMMGRSGNSARTRSTVERSDATLHGRRVAVVPHGEKDDELALAVEIRASLPLGAARRQEIEGAIRAAVTAEHHLDIAEVVFLRPGSLPVTTSGKVQRAKTRALLNQKGLS